VNKKLLFKGATKENAKAYLAAKQVLSARGPHKDPPAVFQILSAHAPTQVRGDPQQQEQNKTWSEEENTQRMAAGDRRRASAEEETEAHARNYTQKDALRRAQNDGARFRTQEEDNSQAIPDGWGAAFDEDVNAYSYCNSIGHTQWEAPSSNGGEYTGEVMNVPDAKTELLEDPVRDTATADALERQIREMTAQKSNLEAAKRKEEDKGSAAKVEEEEDMAAAETAAAEKAAADAKVVILTNIRQCLCVYCYKVLPAFCPVYSARGNSSLGKSWITANFMCHLQ
jgi:hypothetical protein